MFWYVMLMLFYPVYLFFGLLLRSTPVCMVLSGLIHDYCRLAAWRSPPSTPPSGAAPARLVWPPRANER